MAQTVQNPSSFGVSGGGTAQQLLGFSVQDLFKVVTDATLSAQAKLNVIKSRRSSISIGDMFEMQMLMNHLSQSSEMATNVVAASNTAISSMARNVK